MVAVKMSARAVWENKAALPAKSVACLTGGDSLLR